MARSLHLRVQGDGKVQAEPLKPALQQRLLASPGFSWPRPVLRDGLAHALGIRSLKDLLGDLASAAEFRKKDKERKEKLWSPAKGPTHSPPSSLEQRSGWVLVGEEEALPRLPGGGLGQ